MSTDVSIDPSGEDRALAKELANKALKSYNEHRGKSDPILHRSQLFNRDGKRTMDNFFHYGKTRSMLYEDSFLMFCLFFEKAEEIDNITTEKYLGWKERLSNLFYEETRKQQQLNFSPNLDRYTSPGAQRMKTYFENTKWFCYSRLSDPNVIGRRTFEFKTVDVQGVCPVTSKHFYLDVYTPWEGTAKCSGNSLAIETIFYDREGNSSSVSYSLFAIRPYPGRFDVCIGHVTFQNFISGQIVSLTQIMHKYEGDDENFKEATLSKKTFSATELKPIAEFLFAPSRNILITPNPTIHNFKELRDYLKKKNKRSNTPPD